MAKSKKCHCIGILTSGGDCPGLNAAIRAVARTAASYGMEVVGIRDGFRGLVERRAESLRASDVSGILTLGGTILGTSRDKPNKMPMGGAGRMDMTDVAVENYHKLHLDCLICLGGNGTQKNAMHLAKEGGINVVTLPKTIDNDVAMTDVSFGFDTALGIATEAIDRLHSTADSHHRIMIAEIMGHKAGWLALSSGVAGGADVILIPEIPYDPDAVAASLLERARCGKRFSILAVAEGAVDKTDPTWSAEEGRPTERNGDRKKHAKKRQKNKAAGEPYCLDFVRATMGQRVARQIEERTHLETRVTALSHLQRGGTPTPADRLLASQLAVRAIEMIAGGRTGFMMAVQGDEYVPVPLKDVAGKCKLVRRDHTLVQAARRVGTCMGD